MPVEQSGSRRNWNPSVSRASGSPEPSASIADLPVDREFAEREAAAAVPSVEHLKEDLSIYENTPTNESQESPSDVSNRLIDAQEGRGTDDVREADDSREADDGRENGGREADDSREADDGREDGGREADDYGDFQESWGVNAVETSHERTEDMAELDGSPHLEQYPTNLESADVRNVIFLYSVLYLRELALQLIENSTLLKRRFYIMAWMLLNKFCESS